MSKRTLIGTLTRDLAALVLDGILSLDMAERAF